MCTYVHVNVDVCMPMLISDAFLTSSPPYFLRYVSLELELATQLYFQLSFCLQLASFGITAVHHGTQPLNNDLEGYTQILKLTFKCFTN